MLVNANIFLIRHAEQQDNGIELNKVGRSRAQAYSEFLARYKDNEGNSFPFHHLIAAGDIPEKSIRPRQTLEPLANKLSLPLNTLYTENQELITNIAIDPKYSHSNTLICWRHRQLVELCQKLAGSELENTLHKDSFPNTWPNEVFGWIIRLNFNDAGVLTDYSWCQNLKVMYDDHGQNPLDYR